MNTDCTTRHPWTNHKGQRHASLCATSWTYQRKSAICLQCKFVLVRVHQEDALRYHTWDQQRKKKRARKQATHAPAKKWTQQRHHQHHDSCPCHKTGSWILTLSVKEHCRLFKDDSQRRQVNIVSKHFTNDLDAAVQRELRGY